MSIQGNVEAIMSAYPAARDDDRLLISLYWENYDNVIVDLEELLKATSPESIRRARQRIQEDGRLLPTSSSKIGRRRKQKEMEQALKDGDDI